MISPTWTRVSDYLTGPNQGDCGGFAWCTGPGVYGENPVLFVDILGRTSRNMTRDSTPRQQAASNEKEAAPLLSTVILATG